MSLGADLPPASAELFMRIDLRVNPKCSPLTCLALTTRTPRHPVGAQQGPGPATKTLLHQLGGPVSVQACPLVPAHLLPGTGAAHRHTYDSSRMALRRWRTVQFIHRVCAQLKAPPVARWRIPVKLDQLLLLRQGAGSVVPRYELAQAQQSFRQIVHSHQGRSSLRLVCESWSQVGPQSAPQCHLNQAGRDPHGPGDLLLWSIAPRLALLRRRLHPRRRTGTQGQPRPRFFNQWELLWAFRFGYIHFYLLFVSNACPSSRW
jgi:hypothetical protein